MPVGLRNFASSESSPGVCPDPQRQGALDAEHMSGPTRPDLCPDDPGSRACPPRWRQRSRPTSAIGRSAVIRSPHERGAPMSGTKNNQTVTLDEHLRLGAGFAAADRPRILRALSALAPHCSGWEHDRVDLEVSLKDTEGPDQKVTLQAWLVGRAHLVATSHERDLDHALAEVRRDLIRQIEEERSRREPRKRRKTRYRTT